VFAYWSPLVRPPTRTATVVLNGRVMIPSVDEVINFTNDWVVVGPDPLKARLDLWKEVADKAAKKDGAQSAVL
jgi:hypothetical protein